MRVDSRIFLITGGFVIVILLAVASLAQLGGGFRQMVEESEAAQHSAHVLALSTEWQKSVGAAILARQIAAAPSMIQEPRADIDEARSKAHEAYAALRARVADNAKQIEKADAIHAAVRARFDAQDEFYREVKYVDGSLVMTEPARQQILRSQNELATAFYNFRVAESELQNERSRRVARSQLELFALALATGGMLFLAVVFLFYVTIKSLRAKSLAAQKYKTGLLRARRENRQNYEFSEQLAGEILEVLDEHNSHGEIKSVA